MKTQQRKRKTAAKERSRQGRKAGWQLDTVETNDLVQQALAQPDLLMRHPDLLSAVQRALGNQATLDLVQRNCGNEALHLVPAIPGNCHEFVLLDLMNGMNLPCTPTQAIAKLRMASGVDPGSTLAGGWYGGYIVGGGQQVNERSVTQVPVGDILILPSLVQPMHSMVVAEQIPPVPHAPNGETMIRGFNNYGTLGTGTANQDDPTLRSLHTPRHSVRADIPYWTGNGAQFFTTTGGPADIFHVRRNQMQVAIEAFLSTH